MLDTPLPTELQQRLTRATRLGIVKHWAADHTQVTITTTSDDVWQGPHVDADAYLTGLHHGAWAERARPPASTACHGGQATITVGGEGECPTCHLVVPTRHGGQTLPHHTTTGT